MPHYAGEGGVSRLRRPQWIRSTALIPRLLPSGDLARVQQDSLELSGQRMDRFARAIEELHDATALWEGTIRTRGTFDARDVCEGEVQMFQLVGHPEADRCFTWESESDSGARSVHVVLRLPPIDSAEDAVRSVIVQGRPV